MLTFSDWINIAFITLSVIILLNIISAPLVLHEQHRRKEVYPGNEKRLINNDTVVYYSLPLTEHEIALTEKSAEITSNETPAETPVEHSVETPVEQSVESQLTELRIRNAVLEGLLEKALVRKEESEPPVHVVSETKSE